MKVKDVHAVMTSRIYKNILFSDGQTKLVDCLSSIEKPNTLQKCLVSIDNINTTLPRDSPLWPGCTPLHLAVLFFENTKNKDIATYVISQFLDRGASVQVQNLRRASPLHLAFRFKLHQVVATLLKSLEKKTQAVANLLDNERLSHLHIACTARDHRDGLARKLLSNAEDIESTVNVAYKGKPLANVEKGWTPLHVAVDKCQPFLVKILLQRGASTNCKDARGYTAIHQLFGTTRTETLAKSLFDTDQLKDCEVGGVGLTHLHAAACFDDAKIVEKLLDSGANLEAVVGKLEGKDLMKFTDCTPLHVAVIMRRPKTVETLLSQGANVLVKNHGGRSPLSSALTGSQQRIAKAFVKLIRSDEKLQKRLEEELGLTMLHLACYRREPDQVEAELKKGANVNGRLHEDSNFWAGYTPLHLLILSPDYIDRKEHAIFKLLWHYGYDVNQQDITGKTALHLMFASKSIWYCDKVTSTFLSAGADITIVDKNGDSVIPYALKLYSRNFNSSYEIDCVHRIVSHLLCQLHRMKLVGIKTNELDENLAMDALERQNERVTYPSQDVFLNHVQATERIKIGQRGPSVRSFLRETHAISMYPSLTPEDRIEWAAFFKKLDSKGFSQVSPLLRCQYGKTVARLSMVNPARDALIAFICFNFPVLCVDMILEYLSDSELKQLIAAAVDINV